MIVSHRHRFIFLKTRKTAGTSIEIALSRVCGPEDVITPVSVADEQLRAAANGRGPQHVYFPRRSYTTREWAARIAKNRKPAARNHMSAELVRRMVGEKVWRTYYKFAVVRNPWDVVISSYFWKFRDVEHPPSIREFLNSDIIRALLRNYQTYSIRGAIVTDRLCHYESLVTELDEARVEIGLPEPLDLPRAKGGARTDKRHYRDVLDRDEADLVAEKFATEIALLGYEF